MNKFETKQVNIKHLEAQVWVPENPRHAAIVCHPHSLHGGTMNNKVVTTLAKSLLTLDCIVLRFNFRGVGHSQGEFDHGVAETEDVQAVYDWLKENYQFEHMIQAGFSFGSYVSYRFATRHTPDLLILVAPPVENFDFSELAEPTCPMLVLQGEQDEVVDAEKVFRFVESLSNRPQLLRFEQCGHFFHGHLVALKARLIDAIKNFF